MADADPSESRGFGKTLLLSIENKRDDERASSKQLVSDDSVADDGGDDGSPKVLSEDCDDISSYRALAL